MTRMLEKYTPILASNSDLGKAGLRPKERISHIARQKNPIIFLQPVYLLLDREFLVQAVQILYAKKNGDFFLF